MSKHSNRQVTLSLTYRKHLQLWLHLHVLSMKATNRGISQTPPWWSLTLSSDIDPIPHTIAVFPITNDKVFPKQMSSQNP